MTLAVLIATLMPQRPTNMIAQSQSGTGKTAAFVLTMLTRVDISQQYPQVRPLQVHLITFTNCEQRQSALLHRENLRVKSWL